MKKSNGHQELFRSLPKVDELLKHPRLADLSSRVSHNVTLESARSVIDGARADIKSGNQTTVLSEDEIVARVCEEVQKCMQPSLRRVINATGIIVHTNLGRSILAEDALRAVQEVSQGYSTLEYDFEQGKRGSRHDHIESLLCELTGAEAAMAVNNNAAAVMMCIACFARGKEAIVSRGQLVEIGGSFRVPDIMAESGARMIEVGTTNKTHLKDYEKATTSETGLYLKVHSSNYRVVGFTEEVSLEELVNLGAQHSIPVMEDQGSGVLIDLQKYGLPYEPTVASSVAAGADIVTFSGDKLLGGPQAGIIVGKKSAIAKLKAHPMARALRLDKMTLAALEATLMIYRDEDSAVKEIPTLHALTMTLVESRERAEDFAARLLAQLKKCNADKRCSVEVIDEVARAGGGSLPLADIPTAVVALSFSHCSADEAEKALRLEGPVPIVVRIKDNRILLDPRTLIHDDAELIVEQVCQICNQ